jgi:hypothetical protein
VRRIQSAVLVAELISHPVMLVDHFGPEIGADRSGLDQ